MLLACLRFISILGLLLLLINPRITRKSYETIKTPLPIIVDNSSSIKELKANDIALELHKKILSNSALQEKFDVQSYGFDSDFTTKDNFDFKGTQTQIDLVAKNIKSIYKNSNYPTIILTDGNQTRGNDFVYTFPEENAVYPIVLGDTTTVMDLKISQINVNKYAFLKNKFPVEVFLQYAGNKSITSTFSISLGNSIVSKQNITFSATKKSEIISMLLPANAVGVLVFKATISSSEKEKNTYNNTKNFAVEVIDQKTEVALISSLNHPDVGMLKRAIETNQQRHVTILQPNQVSSLRDYNVLIVYQPNATFKTVFESNKAANLNTFVITGTNTDFNFLNQQQSSFEFKMSGQKEDYLADFNTQFNLFALDNIGFDNFPPLQNAFGSIIPKQKVETLLSAKIRNVNLNVPLFSFVENQSRRDAYLFGENIWKWRLQSHIEQQSFDKFDVFIDKTIQFLASNTKKRNLVVTHENFFNSGDAIEINAQFFNKNYEFEENARLTINVVNKETKEAKRYDLLKSTNSYKVNLDGLKAGQYTFNVKELNSNSVYNGFFEVLEFDIEKQFVNPDVSKLQQLATQTNGELVMPNQLDSLIEKLLKDDRYKSIQKEIIKKTPIIDWIWLLILIALTLALEWFIRKYNGLL